MSYKRKEYISIERIKMMILPTKKTDSLTQMWYKDGYNTAVQMMLDNSRRVTFVDAEWDKLDEASWACSCCGYETQRPTAFCPDCGAEMMNWLVAKREVIE